MTGKRISSGDERKLTSAVERAATLASGDAGKDRNELLAKCLLDGGVDSRFAKAASAAFNKRLSVLTFQKANDDNRADSFPLSDAGKVGELMGVKTSEKKTATFSVDMAESGTLKKAASAKCETVRTNYEDRATPEVFERHLVSQLQKLAGDYSVLLGELADFHRIERKLCKEAGEALARMSDGQAEALRERLGLRLSNAVTVNMHEQRKTAADKILADTPELHKVASAVVTHEAYVAAHNAMAGLHGYMTKFAGAAEELGDALHKLAAATPLSAAVPAYMIMKGIGDAGLSSAALLNQVRQGTVDNFSNAYGTALALNGYDKASEAPSKILDSEFLTKDRARDRVLAYSDMSADPMLANQATAGELFAATNKAIDLDPRLERPDQRELLRVYVAKLLTQNGRMDDAGMAALSSIEGQLGKAPGTLDEKAADPIFDLPKYEEKDMPTDLGKLVSILGAGADKLSDKLDLSSLDAAKKWQKEKEDSKTSVKDVNKNSDKDKERTAAALKAIGVRLSLNNGTVTYSIGGGKGRPGQPVSQNQVKKLIDAYNKLNS